MVLNVRRNHLGGLLGTGRWGGGEGVQRWGEREIIYLSLHCHHQNDFCIKMGSDESHFNVSVGSDGQSHKTVSTNHNLRNKLFFETYTGGGGGGGGWRDGRG